MMVRNPKNQNKHQLILVNRLFTSREIVIHLSDGYNIITSEARCKAIEAAQATGIKILTPE